MSVLLQKGVENRVGVTDREKDIVAFEHCLEDCCDGCPNEGNPECTAFAESDWANTDSVVINRKLGKRVLGHLKGQELVKPMHMGT